MKRIKTILILLTLCIPAILFAQTDSIPTTWGLSDCIEYALSKNIDVQKADLTTKQDEVNLLQSKYNRLPSVSGSASQSFEWGKELNSTTNNYGSFKGSNSTSLGVNSSMTLFNGFKLKTQIEQSELNLESSKYYSESVKESMELSILNAYLQILYAQEEISNANKQIESTNEELDLAKERLDIGIFSKSDYLQIKSELASEKLTLANARSTLAIAKVNLMQLMELPVSYNFEVEDFDVTNLLLAEKLSSPTDVYEQALKIKPEIKQAEYNTASAKLEEKIAKADLLPDVSLNAGINTAHSSGIDNVSFTEQMGNRVTPSVGLSVSIPIFQKNQVKTDIKLAQISVKDAQLDEIDTKNTLRKEIEQASVDVATARIKYEASKEQYESVKESYNVASEKYDIGIMNSVDFLLEKTDLITSESDLLQAKYNLIYSNKVLDFYKGIPISLSK